MKGERRREKKTWYKRNAQLCVVMYNSTAAIVAKLLEGSLCCALQAAVSPAPGPPQAAVNPAPGAYRQSGHPAHRHPRQSAVNSVPGPWQPAVNPIPGPWQSTVNPVPGPWQSTVNPVPGPWQSTVNPVPGPWQPAVNPVPGPWQSTVNPVPGPWQPVVNPVPGPWQAAVSPAPGPPQAAVNPAPGAYRQSGHPAHRHPRQSAVNSVPGPWQPAVNPIPGPWQSTVNPVPGPWQSTVNPVPGPWQSTVNPVPGPWQPAVNPVPGPWQSTVNPVPGPWQPVVNPVPGPWQPAVNPVPGPWQSAVSPVPGAYRQSGNHPCRQSGHQGYRHQRRAAVNPVPGPSQSAVNPVHGLPPPPEAVWLLFIQQHYPNRLQETYFLPPLHYNRTFYTVEHFEDEDIVVMQEPQHRQVPHQPRIRRHRRRHQPRPQTYSQGRVFTPNPPDLQPSRHQETNVQDDQAQQHTLQCLKVLSDNMKEVMMVISQLRFRKYLDRDNCTNPVDVAAVARLPNWQSLPAQLAEGECDVLVIHREQGLIVGEIKSTGGGDYFSHQPESEQNRMIVKRVKEAVTQLNNQETALRRLVSDLNIPITRTLITPSLASAQLLRALTNTPVAQVSVSVGVIMHSVSSVNCIYP